MFLSININFICSSVFNKNNCSISENNKTIYLTIFNNKASWQKTQDQKHNKALRLKASIFLDYAQRNPDVIKEFLKHKIDLFGDCFDLIHHMYEELYELYKINQEPTNKGQIQIIQNEKYEQMHFLIAKQNNIIYFFFNGICFLKILGGKYIAIPSNSVNFIDQFLDIKFWAKLKNDPVLKKNILSEKVQQIELQQTLNTENLINFFDENDEIQMLFNLFYTTKDFSEDKDSSSEDLKNLILSLNQNQNIQQDIEILQNSTDFQSNIKSKL